MSVLLKGTVFKPIRDQSFLKSTLPNNFWLCKLRYVISCLQCDDVSKNNRLRCPAQPYVPVLAVVVARSVLPTDPDPIELHRHYLAMIA
jgi:hypothetical protein